MVLFRPLSGFYMAAASRLLADMITLLDRFYMLVDLCVVLFGRRRSFVRLGLRSVERLSDRRLGDLRAIFYGCKKVYFIRRRRLSLTKKAAAAPPTR